VFIALEAVLVISGVWFALMRAAADPRMPIHGATGRIVGIVFLISMFALLFGSPWFIRSLRGVALTGWVLAFLALLYCLLTPSL
jgi:hypothetical protein